MQKFATLAEVSREAGVPASRIQAAVEAGIVTPAGRAGSHPNSPIIFLAADVPSIIDALKVTGRMKAFAATPRPPHQCRNAGEVRAKAEALNRARRDTK